MKKTEQEAQNKIFDSIIQKLELTQDNFEDKLAKFFESIFDHINLNSKHLLNSDLIETLDLLKKDSKQDFLSLKKNLQKRFLETHKSSNHKKEIKTWLKKDFINADKLYQREFKNIVKKSNYDFLKQGFLLDLICAKKTNNVFATCKNSQICKKRLALNEDFKQILTIISDFSQNFSLMPSIESSNILQLKFLLLTEHSQINYEQIVYFSLLPNNFWLKRQSLFSDFILISAKKQLFDKDFFKQFKLDMNRFCNLQNQVFKEKSSYFALDAKICTGALEKLVADFLWLNQIEYKRFCTFSKPLEWANFSLKKYNLEIFLISDFEICVKNNSKNLNSKTLIFDENENKVSAYKKLEQVFIEIIFSDDSENKQTIFKPLNPDEIWQKTASLHENIFLEQSLQILQYLWHKGFTFEDFDLKIEQNLKKIYSSSSVLFFLKKLYEQVWQKFGSALESSNLENYFSKHIKVSKNSFVLLNTNSAFSFLNKEDKNFLASFLAKNKSFSIGKNLENQQDFFYSKNYFEIFNLSCIELTNLDLKLFDSDFLIAKLSWIVKILLQKIESLENSEKLKNNSAGKIAIFVATKIQADLLQKNLRKYNGEFFLEKLKFHYLDFCFDFSSFYKKTEIRQILLLDFYFNKKFLEIDTRRIGLIFPDLTTEILSASRNFYSQILKLPQNKALVFAN